MTSASLTSAVEARARSRCEYCRMHQSLQGASFHVEHIVPRAKGGPTELNNLALACPSCNLYKSDHVEANDPQTHELVGLFHPRNDVWWEHFRWENYELFGISAVGRATVAALHLNSERRLQIRKAEELFRLFPPEDVGQ